MTRNQGQTLGWSVASRWISASPPGGDVALVASLYEIERVVGDLDVSNRPPTAIHG